MPEVAVASVSADAADAGIRIAEEGGNAVDAALASALVSVVTHPAMCSLGGGGYVTVWPESGAPVTVDGGHEMPGRGLPESRFGRGGVEVHLEYAGGVDTVVGPGSVATPGLLAACSRTAERYGRLPWRVLVEPARERASAGFPMPASSHAFLVHAHEVIYGHDPRSRDALHDDEGRLLDPGETIRVEGLAQSLRGLAEEGVDLFYEGELGRLVTEHLAEGGGVLTRADLAAYRPVIREPLECEIDGWRVATNPPPAIGGLSLASMLALMDGLPRARGGSWEPDELRHLARVQEAVLTFRRDRLDRGGDLEVEARRLLELARTGDPGELIRSPSTLHVSTVDSEGNGCAVTLSDGYGSGIVPPGTGIWLNNCLGERELNRRGFHVLEPGTRLPSNMAPTVARRSDGAVLSIGSPGADRIPTAILQVLLNYLRLGMSLEEAIEHPRVHAEPLPGGTRLACEPGLPVGEVDLPVREFDGPSMFFGGVEVAVLLPESGLEAGADSRRTGGTGVGGTPRERN